MKRSAWMIAIAASFLMTPTVLRAQAKKALAREATEFVMRKFGREAAEIGAEKLSVQIERLALTHGDDVFEAVRKLGPKALKLAEEAGEHGVPCVRLMARHGDDAVWVVARKNRMAIFLRYGDDAAKSMMRHGEIAEPMLQSFGARAAKALADVTPQNARRLAMLAEDGQLARIGRTSELLEVVGKYGDRAVDWIWRHKTELATAAVLTAFLNDPESLMDGAVPTSDFVIGGTSTPPSTSDRSLRRVGMLGGVVILIGLMLGVGIWRLSRRVSDKLRESMS